MLLGGLFSYRLTRFSFLRESTSRRGVRVSVLFVCIFHSWGRFAD